MATFGERLARERGKRDWTQQELAKRANVTYETINRIENGKRGPRVYVVVALAKALGTTTDYLCGMYDDESESVPIGASLVGA